MSAKMWIGCLGCYNNGRLIGDWFDADDSAPTEGPEFTERVKPIETGCVHEELWVFDHEGFEGLLTGEFSPATGAKVGAVIEELGDRAAAYGAWRSLGRSSGDLGSDVEEFTEMFQGIHDSEVAFAEHYLDEAQILESLPEHLRIYFDTEHYARDLFLGDYTSSETTGGVYVFRDN